MLAAAVVLAFSCQCVKTVQFSFAISNQVGHATAVLGAAHCIAGFHEGGARNVPGDFSRT